MKKDFLSGTFILCISFTLISLLLLGCSTGIEGTKEIRMSKSDMRNMIPTHERTLAMKFQPDSLAVWIKGKRFVVADDKASFILIPSGAAQHYIKSGDTIRYQSFSVSPTPGHHEQLSLHFSSPEGGSWIYNTMIEPEKALRNFNSSDIPSLIDLDLVDRADLEMQNDTVWLLSHLCYDEDGTAIRTQKFIPVKILRVLCGNMIFPLKVEVADRSGKQFYLFMSVKASSGTGADSRSFDSLFSLSDPRLKHLKISDEIWDHICKGELLIGMTKEECRMSIGNPSDVDAGHNWSSTLDIWRYKDGTFLRFEDGRLVDYRK